MRKVLLLAPLTAALAVVAGCGSSNSSAKTSASVTPPLTTTVTDSVVSPAPATTSASKAPASGPAACATTNLAVSLGTGSGAAGSTYYPLHFANKGSASCTITGFPGVSFVAPGNGRQIGVPAQRTGGSTTTVTLAHGAQATAIVQAANYQNFDPVVCGPVAVSGFRIYPPDNTAAAYVALPEANKACSKNLSSTGSVELQVTAVRAGETGH